MKKIFITFVMLFVFSIVEVNALDIPEANTTYTENWEGTLVIDSDSTIKISNIYHTNDATTYFSAIKIAGNSTVNLVFEGENYLKGNDSKISAGIEVEEGSTVNIYGLDGSKLTAVGGKNSAGIGGVGYDSISTSNPKSGSINIYSGDIEAIGGNKGSGIGSGFHSSASDINISGGNITAIGTGGGAGIGSGYGTSGGASAGAGIGYYNGGNINISGGIVKAAAYSINFDNFDPYNLTTLYGEEYSNTFAAGIGGGYGASSGNIVISGNADVIAIGSCGGTGIGSGRGTTKEDNYDAYNFDVNVTIKDKAKVYAFATDEKRSGVTGQNGGAAIGLGRGTTLEGTTKGTVKIKGNAFVYAVGSYHTNAIGGGAVVGKFTENNDNITEPTIAKLSTLEIDNTATVVAISDNYDAAIASDNTKNFVSILWNGYFLSDDFSEEDFPKQFNAIDVDDGSNKVKFAIQNYSDANIMIQMPNVDKYNFAFVDESELYLANDIEETMTDFLKSTYEITKLSGEFKSETAIINNGEELKFAIAASHGTFEYGSTAFARIINDKNKLKNINNDMDDKYKKRIKNILYLDLGVINSNNVKYEQLNGSVTVYVQMPSGWDSSDIKALFVKDGLDEDLSRSLRLIDIAGIRYIVFDVHHFSNYVIAQYKSEDETVTTFELPKNPDTSDNINTYIVLFITSLISLITMNKYVKKEIRTR